MSIFYNICECGGNTPLVRLDGYCAALNLHANIFAKLEMFNPTGSVKFRAAKYMIERAEERDELRGGATVIEATSGNLGVAVAAIAAAKGYKAVIVMPEGNEPRAEAVKAYGAEIILTSRGGSMTEATDKARRLCAAMQGAFMLNQFCNPDNPKAHTATAREICELVVPDVLIAGVGSGGTVSGAGEYIKKINPSAVIVAVEPEDSPVLSKGYAGAHKIIGIGAGFVPPVLNSGVIDEIAAVSYTDALNAVKLTGSLCGIKVGLSSGAAIAAATRLAKQERNRGKNIVVICPSE